jgi:hypothetical protein
VITPISTYSPPLAFEPSAAWYYLSSGLKKYLFKCLHWLCINR